MKTTEWFICLVYGKYSFLIPHKFSTDNSAVPEMFIDFDRIAMDLFSTETATKHTVALTIRCQKIAMISTSAIPTVFQARLKDFHIPSGLVEEEAKTAGIIAVSFSNNGISLIVNPELLHEKWSKGK